MFTKPIVIVLAALAACALSAAAGPQPTSRPLRVGAFNDVDTLNPLTGTISDDSLVESLLFDSLLRDDGKGGLTGDLALEVPSQHNGGISSDGKTVIFRLVNTARWTDGVSLTASDVAFTFRAFVDPRYGVNEFLRRVLVRVYPADPWSVVFKLRKPYAPFISDVGTQPILPEHLLRGIGDLRTAAFFNAPVGTGPYRLASWRRGDELTFAANRGYFRGAPRIDRLTWKIVPDHQTTINEMRTHEIDVTNGISADQFPQALRIGDWRPVFSNGVAHRYYLALNLHRSILADVRVRRALCDGADLKAIRAKILHGDGTLAAGHISPDSFYYDNALQPCALHIAEGNRLLDDAGWRRNDHMGLRSKDGRVLMIDMAMNAPSNVSLQAALLLQADWRKLGVECTLHRFAPNIYFATREQGGIVASGRFDVALSGLGAQADPSSAAMLTPSGTSNFFGYDNPEVTRLEGDGVRTYDPTKRKAIYRRIQEIVARDVPFITLWWHRDAWWADRRIQGIWGSKPDAGIFWNVIDWSW